MEIDHIVYGAGEILALAVAADALPIRVARQKELDEI